MCDFLISSGGKVAALLVEPVGCQFSYVLQRKKHIKNLRNQVVMLEDLRNGVKGSIDTSIRNREEIREDVKHWIEKVDGFIGMAKDFLEKDINVKDKCFNGWFPDLVLRRQLGKEAKVKTGEAEELLKNGNFNSISNPAPPLGIESIPSGSYVTYETTNLAMMNVMDALSDDKINFIGIHGMGGVGKTTLVKEIGKKVIFDDCKLFDDVVMALVSENQDLKKIQDQLAGMLGLKLHDRPSEIERASELCARLKNVKKILVILDDVWARLDLEAVGIPFGHVHQGCKIIITTRREQVCRSMGLEWERTKIVHPDVLSEQDSWDLFRKNAGDFDCPTLNVVAKKVFKECGNLPITLVTVGSAMKGKYDLEEWKEAAQELRKSISINIEGVQQVYKSLKLSYDYWEGEEAKACFLLCSLFPEGYAISIEDLVRYGMGLKVFKHVDTVNEARSRANLVINNLKASCLLLASDEEGCVKMHKVIRDVAISTGSNKYFVRTGYDLKNWPNVDIWDQYTGISLMRNQISCIHPDVWECPTLQILLLQYNQVTWYGLDNFFSGMKAVKVLDLSYNSSMPFTFAQANALCHLTCLQTLRLEGITIGDSTFLGKIRTLEVLSLKRAFLLEAPNAIRELTNLRLLDMTESMHRFLIPANVVLPLSHLEELYMYGITIEDPNLRDIVVAALRSLPRLHVLTISILDFRLIPEDFVFPELENFLIFIGCFNLLGDLTPNYLVLGDLVGPTIRWRECLKMLLKRASSLLLWHLQDMKDIFPHLSDHVDGLNVLKFLRIEYCCQLEYLINIEEWGTLPHAQHEPDLQVLSNLEELRLENLDTFKGICQVALNSSWVCFLKLRYMRVYSCGKLKYVFQHSIARALQRLQELYVIDCEEVEEIVAKQNERQEEHVEKMVFKNLKVIELFGLPNLSGFCTGNFSLEWPSLETLTVEECPKMKNIFANLSAVVDGLYVLKFLRIKNCCRLEYLINTEEWATLPLARQQPDLQVLSNLEELRLEKLNTFKRICQGAFTSSWGSFTKLVYISVASCNQLKYVFQPSIARALLRLEMLYASDCEELEEIVAKQNEVQEERVDKVVFKSLKGIILERLPNLCGFCTGNLSFEWPSLEKLIVFDCPKMKTFGATTSGIQSTPKLKTIELNHSETTLQEGMNLNQLLQNHFKAKGK